MAAIQTSGQPPMANITESVRRFSLKSSRTSSHKTLVATSVTGSSDATIESSSNSSRPSITESGRRRSSLASFSSMLKKSKRQTPSISEDSALAYAKLGNGRIATLQTQSESDTLTLGDRFFALPAEIQTIILAYLPITELLSFRRVSRSCLAIFQANSFTITRNAIYTLSSEEDDDPWGILLHLYPSTFSSTTTDAYFLRTIRRKAIVERQLKVLLTFIQTRVYMLKLTRELECEHFAPYRPGLRDRLFRPITYIQHLLETVRYLVIRSHPDHLSPRLTIDLCPACTSSLESVIASYPTNILVPAYQVIQLLLQHFRTATRSPSSVTAFERKLRGWTYGPPPEEHMSQLVFLGGIQELSRIDEMQGSYSKRLGTVKSFADTISEAVRINGIAFPDIYKTSADPVMGTTSTNAKIPSNNTITINPVVARDRYQNLHNAIEAFADDDSNQQPITKSLDVNLYMLTEPIVKSVPNLEAFLIGPNSLLGRIIMKGKLVEHERDLLTPYGFVTKLMSESYESSGAGFQARMMNSTGPRSDGADFVYSPHDGYGGHGHGSLHSGGDAGGGGGGDGGGGGGGS